MKPEDHNRRAPRLSRRARQTARTRRKRARRRRLAMSMLAAAGVAALIVVVAGRGWAPSTTGSSAGVGSMEGGAHAHAHAHDTPSNTTPPTGATSGQAGAHARARGTPPNTTPPTEPTSGQADAEAIESPQVRGLIALGRPIYCAGRTGDEVSLTFDDGPGTYTKLAIAKLRKHGVKATFFIVGRNIELLPSAIHEERTLGAVGDHTFTHPLLTALPSSLAESEIVRTQSAVERASGGPVFLFRPPYGARNSAIDSIARDHNLLEILWTVDSRDSLGANYAQIERNVINGMHPGSIILMHENHGQTIRAMLSIFAALQRKHLRAVSVPRLLTDDPPSAAQVRAGGLGCGTKASAGRGGG